MNDKTTENTTTDNEVVMETDDGLEDLQFRSFAYAFTSEVPGGIRYEEWMGDDDILVSAKEIRQQAPDKKPFLTHHDLATSDAAKEVIADKADIDSIDDIEIV